MEKFKDILDRYWRLNIVIAINALFVIYILLRNTRNFDFDFISWVYLISVGLGYYVLAIYVITSIAFLVLLPFRRLAVAVMCSIVTILVYYLLIDSLAFSIINMHIDLFWMKWIIEDFGAFGLSAGTLRSAAIAFVVLLAVETIIFILSRKIRRRRFMVWILWIVLPLFFMVSQTIHAISYEVNDIRITGMTPQFPFYAPVTSHKQAARYAKMMDIEGDEASKSTDGHYEAFHYPLHEIVCEKPDSAGLPNIVILFLESWRSDMMNDSITPNIYALAQKSTDCRNHLCSGNSTVAGVFGFFYGLYPTYWPMVKAANVAIHNPVLMDVLTDYNYKFGIFAKSHFERHKIKDAVFRDITVHEDFPGEREDIQDANLTRRLMSFIREQHDSKNPFLAFAFYKANHAPYRYPANDTVYRPADDLNLVGISPDTDPVEYFNDYRNATGYVDQLIGKVLDELDSLGMMDNTIIIVSTDHGEEFNDKRTGYWGHGTDYTSYQIQVPLVFYAPGKEHREIEKTTCHIDIAPTLLQEFLGCKNPVRDYSNGQNLFRDFEPSRPMIVGGYVNHAIVIDDNVYEISPHYVKEYKLDNVESEADPPSQDRLSEIIEGKSRFLEK